MEMAAWWRSCAIKREREREREDGVGENRAWRKRELARDGEGRQDRGLVREKIENPEIFL